MCAESIIQEFIAIFRNIGLKMDCAEGRQRSTTADTTTGQVEQYAARYDWSATKYRSMEKGGLQLSALYGTILGVAPCRAESLHALHGYQVFQLVSMRA
jgi:hypothetical protein